MGTLAAACSSNTNQPPAASAASIDAASSTPSNAPDFAPVANDGTASAAPANHASTTASNVAPSNVAPSNGMGTAKANTTSTAPYVAPPNPGPNSGAGNAQAMPTPEPGVQPDNTKINKRDKDSAALTPMDQGGSEGDRKITQQIRQAVMKDGSLSFTAKNAKIITIDGKVTLRGPVNSAAERSAIEAAAKAVAGVTRVDNQLEVKN